MPIDLYVYVDDGVDVLRLLRDTALTLQEILGLTETPDIVAHELDRGSLGDLRLQRLSSPEDPAIVVQVSGEPDAVVANLNFASAAGRPFVSIAMASRTPLGFALGASVAVALARRENTDVVDQAGLFVEDVRIPAEEFAQRVRAEHSCPDRDVAARMFISRIGREADLE